MHDAERFSFNFYLWLRHRDVYFKYRFRLDSDTLRALYNKKEHRLCFADKAFPKRVLRRTLCLSLVCVRSANYVKTHRV